MSSLGDAVGQQINWFTGKEGKNEVEMLVKNRALQGRLNKTLGDYDTTKTASNLALEDYIKQYLAGGSTATARSNQEQGVVDRYYNGEIERRLADLRTRRAQVSKDALARSMGYAFRNQNADRILGAGGPSSYDRQLALKTGADLDIQSAMENLALERGDFDYLNRSQLALMGQRTGMADALAGRALVPAQARKAEMGWNLDALRQMIALDQANKFYGVKYDPSVGEEIGQHVGDLANAAMQAYSMYTGGGMGGGGGQQQSRLPSTATNWGGMGGGAPAMSAMPAMNYSVGPQYSVNPYEQTPIYGGASNFELPPMGQTYQAYVPNGWGYGS